MDSVCDKIGLEKVNLLSLLRGPRTFVIEKAPGSVPLRTPHQFTEDESLDTGKAAVMAYTNLGIFNDTE